MRVLNSVRYDSWEFQPILNGYYWVLHERSKPVEDSRAYIIVDQAKLIYDGKTYFLNRDGSITYKHRVVSPPIVQHACRDLEWEY